MEIGPQTGWQWLRDLGVHPPGAAAVAPALGRRIGAGSLEKHLRERLRRLREANPGKAVEVWAEEEARTAQ